MKFTMKSYWSYDSRIPESYELRLSNGRKVVLMGITKEEAENMAPSIEADLGIKPIPEHIAKFSPMK